MERIAKFGEEGIHASIQADFLTDPLIPFLPLLKGRLCDERISSTFFHSGLMLTKAPNEKEDSLLTLKRALFEACGYAGNPEHARSFDPTHFNLRVSIDRNMQWMFLEALQKQLGDKLPQNLGHQVKTQADINLRLNPNLAIGSNIIESQEEKVALSFQIDVQTAISAKDFLEALYRLLTKLESNATSQAA